MKSSCSVCIAALIAALELVAGAKAVAADTLIRGAKVYTVAAQGTLDNGDVLIHDDKIAAVGTGLTAPAGATVIDANGRVLTPGFFGGLTAIGLEEVQLEESTVEETLDIKAPFHEAQLRPEFDPTVAFNPRSTVVPVTRIEGVTWTVLAPGTPVFGGGNFVTGQGAAVTLDGRFDAELAGSRSLFVSLGAAAFPISGGSLAAQLMLLDQAVREVRAPASAGKHALLTPAGREALGRYLNDGRVVFHVDRAADIRQAIAFAKRNHMKPVIAGGSEAWVVAADLARDKVPVILVALADLPGDFDRVGARLDNAALLQKAGVTISFMLDDEPTHNARKLRQTAGVAVAHGLPFDAALAGLTANPADIFGLGATRGRIARGQTADVVLWTGDPLEVSTLADQVWIAGRPVEMRSRQTELRDRYLERVKQHQAR
ncbi:MAG TPA: amidohydrolase family protein [Steroidobacteraceae bacterium]|nr:amidohydrolase family protein [Steroidobacteraceae bacterium]